MSEAGQENILPVASEVEQRTPLAFIDSEFVKMREKASKEGYPFGVLFTDLDDTFYRKDRKEESNKLVRMADEKSIPIVIATGNNYKGVLGRIEQGELPYFSVIAGSVGTEIWVLHIDQNGKKHYVKDQEYENTLLKTGFDRRALGKTSFDMIKTFGVDHLDWQFKFQKPDVELAYQKGEKVEIEPFKISFDAFSSGENAPEQIYKEVASRFPGQKVVVCEDSGYKGKDGETGKKYFIDILPATKADAVNYISHKMQVDIAGVAGDSGNDSTMLTGTGNIAFRVGGSKPELNLAIQEAVTTGKGRGSFRKIENPDGTVKIYYGERGVRLGPESIIYAAQVLKRAQQIFGNRQTTIP